MRFIHRLVFWVTPEFDAVLADLGLVRTNRDGEFEALEVYEDDPRWPALKPTLVAMDLESDVWTEFSDDEFRSAKWLRMGGGAQMGYPQPVDDYMRVTYDCSTICQECSAGYTQVAPFRMKKSPRWGRRLLGVLESVGDAYFTTEAAYREVFEGLGIESMPVLDAKGRAKLDGVVQLVPSTELVEIDVSELETENCERCGVPRSRFPDRGMFPHVADGEGHLRLTERNFGSGASSYREVIVSQEFYAAVVEAGSLGPNFWPCAER